MPVLPRRPLRPAVVIAVILVLGIVPFDGLFAPRASGVLGIREEPMAAGAEPVATDGVGLAAVATRESVRVNRDGESLLRFSKETKPVQRIAPLPETLTGYRWPLTQVRITQPFGPARGGSWIVNGKPFHDGLDVATFCGDRVNATHDGVVLAAGRNYDDFMGWIGDLGPYYTRLDAESLWLSLPIVVVIDDGNGYRSTYAHFSKVVVKAGDVLNAGAFLGYEGRTGNATGCHVHYGLFSPDEVATMQFDPKQADKMKLPSYEIARVDPQRVMPPPPPLPSAPPSP